MPIVAHAVTGMAGRLPMVPFLPCMTVIFNTILISQLSWMTWSSGMQISTPNKLLMVVVVNSQRKEQINENDCPQIQILSNRRRNNGLEESTSP
ncbi:hypothetical protein ACTXT7_016582 [Hymenolepis weldensis]